MESGLEEMLDLLLDKLEEFWLDKDINPMTNSFSLE